MTIKSFVIGLILSKILTSIGVALIASHFDPEMTSFQYFILFMLTGTANGILSQIAIFTIYFFAIRLLVNKIRAQIFFYMLLILLALAYFSLVTVIDWNLSKGRYGDFRNYLYHGNYYLIDAVVSILLVTIIGIKTRTSFKSL